MNPRLITAIAACGAISAGCESPMSRIDRSTTELLAETNRRLGQETLDPALGWEPGTTPPAYNGAITDKRPATVNPASSELTFPPEVEADQVVARLEAYAQTPPDALAMDLDAALAYAVEHSREHRFAEEDYLLVALRLLIERHRWGPRFFNDTTVEFLGTGDDGLYDTALDIVNDFRVTQRLPYGGAVSAQFLARATEDLHVRVAGENVQTADLIFSAEVPLLRGAGLVAQEDLILAERSVIYAARAFEHFRREFLVDITSDFLDLVIQLEAIRNGEANVQMLEGFERRERALVESGRDPPFQAALAEQATLFARDRLNDQREVYRLSVDRFRVRLGMPEDLMVRIVPDSPGLPPPAVDLEVAVRAAMVYRLDLQNRRDLIDDAKRGVNNARNAILADLNLAGSVTVPTDDTKDRAGLDFDLDDTSFRVAMVLGLPLDRTIERLDLRQSQIVLERVTRDYDEFRDTVVADVRAAVRNIDRALFSQRLQEQNVRVAEMRLESINAAPDRATARDRSEAASDLLQAQDDLLAARRGVQVAVLRYLLDSGQMRVAPDGTILPLQGMVFREEPFDAGAPMPPPPPPMAPAEVPPQGQPG
jgi:outer membrane protein TolC